jgi:serine/threonine protein kinase/formylglycine-generating enzyme required for sulfatase activity
MVQSPTNGHGKDQEHAEARTAHSTHESGPGDRVSDGGDTEALARGSALGRYLVLERLGAGAMGVVYAAYDPELDRKVAIKILRPQAGAGDGDRRRARLVREAKAIAKLSHPNVVGIFDVGVHEGQVFLAMEYLGGGTLRDWMSAAKRPWRETVSMFAEIGNGLAAAHGEGLIHRDFKPDNVLLDKGGKPKVVDFGLVRLTTSLDLTASLETHEDAALDEHMPESPPASAVPAGAVLTRTGALTGTPAYMAPEQFLGRAIDARTDQFAFCVALYEALYGERPFAGETVISLADSVSDGRMRALPKNADVPNWIRACVIRGLRVVPEQRYAVMSDLLVALTNDPVVRRRRRLLLASGATVAIAGILGARHLVVAKRQEIEQRVSQHIAAADGLLKEASRTQGEARSLKSRALAAFDGFDRSTGEELWAQSLASAGAAATAYEQGIQELDAAFTLERSETIKSRTADAIVEYLGLDDLASDQRQAALRQLSTYDDDGARRGRLEAPAHLRITTTPEPLNAQLETYDPSTHRVSGPPRRLGQTPIVLDLAPGAYRLVLEGTKTLSGFSYPLLLTANETFERSIPVPRRSSVPEGFVFIPEGRFLFGSAYEGIRAVFLETTPLHVLSTGGFLIARHETTVGEWISFLKSLSTKERSLRRPQGRRDAVGGFVDLRETGDGHWEYTFRATKETYVGREGEALRYRDRARRVTQDWSRLPVSGVSPDDASAYAKWLDRSGRVPGARLCNEREWERAARGADAREFPHGNRLLADDANFDLTYGRREGGYGLDEVGSHPASDSPFGVEDLVGNVWEMTASVLDRNQFVVRGGSFYLDMKSLLSSNREPIGSVSRDHTIGLRICADAHL